jgi:hypothetical protein
MPLEAYPHPEERPLRDAACGGSSGQGARLEGRKTLMQPFA